MSNNIQTVEDMVEDLIRERNEFKEGVMDRGDLLASANHAGKAFKGISLMLANAALRGETPAFAVLGNRSGEGSGIPKAKRLTDAEAKSAASSLIAS
jgi:hypothetical protein